MHCGNFVTRSNDTTGERGGGHHCPVKRVICKGKPLSSPERLGMWDNTHAQGLLEPLPFQWQRSGTFPGSRHSPLSLTQGTTTLSLKRTEAPPPAASQLEKKTQCRSLFLRTKGFCALLLEQPPLPPPNLQEGGQRAIFQRPPVYLGNEPTPPRREKLRRSPKEPTSSPAGDSDSRAPAQPAAPPADQTREGQKRRAGSCGSGPAQPAHLPLPGRRAPGPLAPEPAGRPSPGPRFHGGQEAAAPRASGGGGGRNPGALGRAAPPSRARQDAWGLVRPAHPRGGGLTGPGRGPPPEAGRIRRGPRPGAGGGRVPAAGRAGRPAGGRRVAAAPGLK